MTRSEPVEPCATDAGSAQSAADSDAAYFEVHPELQFRLRPLIWNEIIYLRETGVPELVEPYLAIRFRNVGVPAWFSRDFRVVARYRGAVIFWKPATAAAPPKPKPTPIVGRRFARRLAPKRAGETALQRAERIDKLATIARHAEFAPTDKTALSVARNLDKLSPEAKRAELAIAALSEDGKRVAIETGLDRERHTLLTAARMARDRQAAFLQNEAARREWAWCEQTPLGLASNHKIRPPQHSGCRPIWPVKDGPPPLGVLWAPRIIADGSQSAVLHDILDLSHRKEIEAATGKRALKLRREVAKKLEMIGVVDCILRGDRATSWQTIAAKLKQPVLPKEDVEPADLVRPNSGRRSKQRSKRRAEYRKTHAEKVRQAARLTEAKITGSSENEGAHLEWLDAHGFN